jgi:hypothetical protein
MSFITRRLVGIAASTVLLSLVSATAHAQLIDVFSGGTLYSTVFRFNTVYTFSSSMILNSIGFQTHEDGDGVFEFAINGGGFANASTSSLGTFNAADSSGVRWFQLINPVTLGTNGTVNVQTSGYSGYRYNQTLNSAANVDFVTGYDYGSGTGVERRSDFASNSNLRVSAYNPSANVAPEPGTFALALTGGAALLGICIRRRRNAA